MSAVAKASPDERKPKEVPETRIVAAIQAANPERTYKNLNRRLVKVLEELGEISEAYPNITSPSNAKGKSWGDVREEAVDALIVLVDVALTPLPKATYPAGALLTSLVREGLEYAHRLQTSEDFEACKFAIAKATATAAECSRAFIETPATSHEMHYLGAMSKAIRAAAQLCFSQMPDNRRLTIREIEELVEAEVDRKLAKWADNRAKQAVVTDGAIDTAV